MQTNIIVDTSEIKTWRHCKRQWAFNSRNKMHLQPSVKPKALNFGTLFHVCLHAMYNKQPIEIDSLRNQMDEESFRILENIVSEYAKLVLPTDLLKYEILATELKFTEPISGSVDMVVKEKSTGNIYGMEHKTGKTFRADIFNLLDEQPMMYTIAIKNIYGRCDGILLNEIKKLKTKLDQKRTKLTYTNDELDFFLTGILKDKEDISAARNKDVNKFQACPDFAKCSMCDFQPLCLELRVDGDILRINQSLLDTYGFIVREQDHLNEDKEINLTIRR